MWGIRLGLRGVVYQADLPSTAGSRPHHQHPASREKSSAQLRFHLTYLTPLPGITGANTSLCLLLACCLVCLSYLLPWNLTSPHWGSEPFCYRILTRYCRIAVDCTVKTAQSDVILSVSSLLTTLSWSLVLKHRNWYPSSSTSQKCLSTAMATI